MEGIYSNPNPSREFTEYECWYVSEGGSFRDKYTVEASSPKEAAMLVVQENPDDSPRIEVYPNGSSSEKTTFNVNELQQIINTPTNAEKKAEQEAQRQADIASLSDSIEILKTGSPDDLKYSQLKTVIENYLLFPQLGENEDANIYRLREELYLLSFLHPRIQSGIQTRILGDKLDALHAAITGVANNQVGIANDQAKRNKNNLIGQAATIAALGRIEQDTSSLSDFFG